jgi:hypothetical protein
MALPLNLPSRTKGQRGLAGFVGCWIIPSVWVQAERQANRNQYHADGETMWQTRRNSINGSPCAQLTVFATETKRWTEKSDSPVQASRLVYAHTGTCMYVQNTYILTLSVTAVL